MSVEQERIDFIKNAHANVICLIQMADNKANITLSLQSMILSVGLGSALLTSILHDNDAMIFAYIIFILISLIGIVLSIFVYLARTSVPSEDYKKGGLFYMEHILELQNSQQFNNQIQNIELKNMIEEYAIQTFIISGIAKQKMTYLRCSIFLLFLNIVYFAGLMLISALSMVG